MKYQLLSDKFYQARQRPGGFELISFNRQPVQSSAPWVGWTDNSDCCMNMNCPAWASSGLNCLAGSLATPVGPVKTFYKSLQQTDRQTYIQTVPALIFFTSPAPSIMDLYLISFPYHHSHRVSLCWPGLIEKRLSFSPGEITGQNW